MRCFVNSPLRRTTHLAAAMKLEFVVHETEEGGYWAEAPAIPGCATQADSFEELLNNLHEAIEGCLCVDVRDVAISPGDLDVAARIAGHESTRTTQLCNLLSEEISLGEIERIFAPTCWSSAPAARACTQPLPAAARDGARVVLADENMIGRGGATVMAQMTVAAVLAEEEPDSREDHLADTLAAGRGLCDSGLAEALCRAAPDGCARWTAGASAGRAPTVAFDRSWLRVTVAGDAAASTS